MLAYFKTITSPNKLVYEASFPELMLIISIFSKEIGSRRILGIDFDFIAYPFAILYFLFYLKEIFLSETFPWKLYLYLISTSLFSILTLNLLYSGFFKQIVPIIIILSVNFFILTYYDWRKVFRMYVKFAFLTALFGIFQVLLSYTGVKILTEQVGRLDSVAYEPSHYATILVPALVFCFFYFQHYKLYFAVMLTALILTYNLTGYMSFLVVISIAYINPLYLIISIPVLYYLVFHVLIHFNSNFNVRILDTLAVFKGDINVLNKNVDANGTTVSLYSNLMVADDNLKKGNLIGSGLGGHEEMYHRFYKNSTFKYNWFYGINAVSAHSLTIRIFSELGIVGLICYIITIIRSVTLLDNGIYRTISLACLSHFICKSFKLAGFIDYGTPFFFAMLLINFKRYSQHIEK